MKENICLRRKAEVLSLALLKSRCQQLCEVKLIREGGYLEKHGNLLRSYLDSKSQKNLCGNKSSEKIDMVDCKPRTPLFEFCTVWHFYSLDKHNRRAEQLSRPASLFPISAFRLNCFTLLLINLLLFRIHQSDNIIVKCLFPECNIALIRFQLTTFRSLSRITLASSRSRYRSHSTHHW